MFAPWVGNCFTSTQFLINLSIEGESYKGFSSKMCRLSEHVIPNTNKNYFDLSLDELIEKNNFSALNTIRPLEWARIRIVCVIKGSNS